MKRLAGRLWAFFIAFPAIWISSISAEVKPAEEWLAAIKKQAEIFQSIRSWNFKTTTIAFPSSELAGRLNLRTEPTVSEFEFWSTKKGWRYEIAAFDAGEKRLITRHAFNSEVDQLFYPEEDILYVSKKRPTLATESLGKYGNYVFSAYSFLVPDESVTKAPVVTPSPFELFDEAVWAPMFDAQIEVLDDTRDEMTLFIKKKKSSYAVTLRKDAGYSPIRMKRYDSSRQIISDVQVEEMQRTEVPGTGEVLFLPKKIVVKEFEAGQLAITATSTLEGISINNLQEDDDIFTLDFALARKIYDVDGDVFINVPK